MKNGLSIDLEDYFHATIFSKKINRAEWDNYPSRVEANTYKILDILSSNKTKATFFVLGWIARRFPSLIKAIANEGHEIALHGYNHQLVREQTPAQFLEDLTRAKAVTEDITGTEIAGYRAPSFSIYKSTSWALEIIRSLGFKYDSSIFPVGIASYKNIPMKPFEIIPGLFELPLPVIKCAGIGIPFGGGIFLRVFPYSFNRWAISYFNKKENAPAIIYLHPWELDPEQPRFHSLTLANQIRHYINLDKCKTRFKRLIKNHSFCTLSSIYKNSKSNTNILPL